MHKTFVTFGWDHSHEINSNRFDKDCVGVVKTHTKREGIKQVENLFGTRFSFAFPEDNWQGDMSSFPRGYLMANDECWAPGDKNCTCPACGGNNN